MSLFEAVSVVVPLTTKGREASWEAAYQATYRGRYHSSAACRLLRNGDIAV